MQAPCILPVLLEVVSKHIARILFAKFQPSNLLNIQYSIYNIDASTRTKFWDRKEFWISVSWGNLSLYLQPMISSRYQCTVYSESLSCSHSANLYRKTSHFSKFHSSGGSTKHDLLSLKFCVCKNIRRHASLNNIFLNHPYERGRQLGWSYIFHRNSNTNSAYLLGILHF